MANRLDFIIFGATGFTGQYTVEELIRLSAEKPCTWGIAGRNKSKLESLLKKIGTKLGMYYLSARIQGLPNVRSFLTPSSSVCFFPGKDLSSVEVVVADVDDAKSLEAMAARAKVVINCCGPYRHWGEQVVKACIASGTNHVDVSGEPQVWKRSARNE